MVTLMGKDFRESYLFSHPEMAKALETGMVEGVPFRLLDGEIEEGDSYLAERNTGLHLLTCRKNDKFKQWIEPVQHAYIYDTPECIRIELLID